MPDPPHVLELQVPRVRQVEPALRDPVHEQKPRVRSIEIWNELRAAQPHLPVHGHPGPARLRRPSPPSLPVSHTQVSPPRPAQRQPTIPTPAQPNGNPPSPPRPAQRQPTIPTPARPTPTHHPHLCPPNGNPPR